MLHRETLVETESLNDATLSPRATLPTMGCGYSYEQLAIAFKPVRTRRGVIPPFSRISPDLLGVILYYLPGVPTLLKKDMSFKLQKKILPIGETPETGGFSWPCSICFDHQDRVFVVGTGHRVYIFGHDGTFLKSHHTLRFISNWHGEDPGIIHGIFDHKGQFILLDQSGTILGLKVEEDLSFTKVLDLPIDRGDGPTEVLNPRQLAITFSKNYAITDYVNDRVQVYGPKGAWVRTIGSPGTISGKFKGPTGIVCHPINGDLYIGDFVHRIQVFNEKGDFKRVIATRGTAFGQVDYPWGMFIDRNGRLLVADSSNERVQIFSEKEDKPLQEVGNKDGVKMIAPYGVAVDRQGCIWVCDRDDKIFMFG